MSRHRSAPFVHVSHQHPCVGVMECPTCHAPAGLPCHPVQRRSVVRPNRHAEPHKARVASYDAANANATFHPK